MNIRATNKSITRKLTKIENALKSKLNTFYNKKIKPLSYLPIDAIRRQYESQVKTLIRKTIQDAYLTGTDTVADSITEKDKNFQVFISQTDIRNIASLTEKMNDQFWKTTGRLVRREQEFILTTDKQLVQKKGFDTEAALIGFSAFAAFGAFNNAVVSKMQNTIPVGPRFVSSGQLGLEFDVGFDITLLDNELPLEGRVMFLTQEDAAVDPEICEPLNRTVYDVTDLDIPEPPLHNHCRCRLIPLISGEESLV